MSEVREEQTVKLNMVCRSIKMSVPATFARALGMKSGDEVTVTLDEHKNRMIVEKSGSVGNGNISNKT